MTYHASWHVSWLAMMHDHGNSRYMPWRTMIYNECCIRMHHALCFITTYHGMANHDIYDGISSCIWHGIGISCCVQHGISWCRTGILHGIYISSWIHGETYMAYHHVNLNYLSFSHYIALTSLSLSLSRSLSLSCLSFVLPLPLFPSFSLSLSCIYIKHVILCFQPCTFCKSPSCLPPSSWLRSSPTTEVYQGCPQTRMMSAGSQRDLMCSTHRRIFETTSELSTNISPSLEDRGECYIQRFLYLFAGSFMPNRT